MDDTGALNLTEAVVLLYFLFLGEMTPPAPIAACGTDSTDDGPPCEAFLACS